MSMTTAVEHALLALYPGQRIWFWCSPESPEPHPPLLVTPLSDDPDMAQLKAYARAVPLRPGAAFSMGAGHVDEDGTLKLGGSMVSANMLAPIADWARANVGAHPGLASLKGLTLMTVQNGQITAVHSDDTLWESMPMVSAPGSMGDTAARLSQLEQSHWFALRGAGANTPPMLMLHPQESDPDGQFFSRWLMNTQTNSDDSRVIKGLLQDRGNWLAMTTGDDTSGWQEMLASLLSHWAYLPALERLLTVRMVHLEDEEIRHVEAFQHDVPLTPPAHGSQ